MAESEEVVLPVNVDPKDAVDGLNKFEKKSKDTASVFKGVLGAEAVLAVVKAAGSAISSFSDYFSDGVAAAQRQEQSLKNLEIQLALTGEASSEALKGFDSFAGEMELLAGIDDDVILGQIALAKSFGTSNEQAKELVTAAIELSSVTGKSLNTTMEELGKTLTGVAGRSVALRNATQGMTKEQLEAGGAIRAVLDQFGGTTQNRMATFSGSLKIMETQWANLGELFGEVVVKNPMVVAAIQELTDIIVWLQGVVSENQDSMRDWIEFGITASASAFLAAVDGIRFFADGLNGLISVGALLLSGLGEVVGFMNNVWNKTIGRAGEAMLTLMESMGVLEEGVAKSFRNITNATQTAIENTTNSLYEFAAEGEKRARQIGEAHNTVSRFVDGATTRIITAHARQGKSLKNLSTAYQNGAEAAEKSAKDIEKAREEAAKLEADIFKDTEDNIQKAIRIRDEFATRIQKQLDDGIISQQKAADLSTKIEADLISKLEIMRAEADTKALEAEQKRLDEEGKLAAEAAQKARERVEKIASNPIAFVIKNDLTTQDLAPLLTGMTSSMLDGAAGAEKMLSQGLGAVADSVVPGIGGAVSGLVTQLAKGPEENKKMIREFVGAFPMLIENIMESIPAIVEALVDSLINEGGIIKIAIAFAQALVGEAIWKAIGKAIGLEFGDAFNAANIGGTIEEGIKTGMTYLSNFIGMIPAKLGEGARFLFTNIQTGFQKAWEWLEGIFGSLGDMVAYPFQVAFEPLVDLFDFDWPDFPSLPKLEIPTPSWLNRIIDVLNAIKTEKVKVSGKVLGKRFSFTLIPEVDLIPGNIPAFAEGATSIPPGFEEDGLVARVESYERIVSGPQNRDLSAFLEDYKRGESGGGFDDEALQVLKSIANALERSSQGGEIVVKIDSREISRTNVKNSKLNRRTA